MYSNEMVCKIIVYINENINKEITINELVNLTFFDKTYIMKRFKKELGISIHSYINNLRIYNSLSYFKYNDSFLSIGLKNGFNSLEYFSETFRKVMSVNPRKYKYFINDPVRISNMEYKSIISSIQYLNELNYNVNTYLSKRKKESSYIKKIQL